MALEVRMKNFVKIADGIDTTAIHQELQRNEVVWQADTARQRDVQCQRETESIFLRGAHRTDETIRLEDVHQSKNTALSIYFPSTMDWLKTVAHSLHGELGRAMFAKLKPNGQVYPHIDGGAYYALRHRFHLVIQSRGSLMKCDGEEIVMNEGELWAFDNKKTHEAFNESADARIHLIFDLLIQAPL